MKRIPHVVLAFVMLAPLLSLNVSAQQEMISPQQEIIIGDGEYPGPGDEPIYTQQTVADRVLVVYNGNVPASYNVANHYITRRGVSAANLLEVRPSNEYEIPYTEFESAIKNPIRSKLNALGRSRILYVVFSYRTPYKVNNAPITIPYSCGDCGRGTSLDQRVADIWDQTHWSSNPNPYYASAQTKANQYQPFVTLEQFRNQNSSLVYSVWRLDAPTADLAKGLVDKAISAETNGLQGVGYFDRNRGALSYASTPDDGYIEVDWNFYRAAEFARKAGFSVAEDINEAVFGTSPARLRADNAAMYAGWYNLSRYNDAFSWNAGAIGFDVNSDAAASFRDGTRWCGGALQSGITVTGGAISEPYTTWHYRFDGFFRNLFGAQM